MTVSMLAIKALPKPINGEKWVEAEYSCSECDESGVIRFTDSQWREMIDNPPKRLCPKCGGLRGMVVVHKMMPRPAISAF